MIVQGSRGLPSRSTIEHWDALTASDTIVRTLGYEAERLDSHTRSVDRQRAAVSGEDWIGTANQAADDRIADACARSRKLSTGLVEVAGTVETGLSELHYARRALLSAVAEAEADGCRVADDWTVTIIGPPTEESEAKVFEWAGYLRFKAAAVQEADSRAAQSIADAAAALTFGSNSGIHGFVPIIALGAVDLALMAALAAGAISAGAILLWVSEHFPSINLQQVLDIMPSTLTNDGPGQWEYPNRGGTSERAGAYEEQVTGSPAGVEYAIPKADGSGNVLFDGWDPDAGESGKLIEAKGPGYEWMVGDDGQFKPNMGAAKSLPDQLRRQSEAAESAGAEIEWRVAEERVAEAIEDMIDEAGYENITVKYVPPE
ncbi:Uncharacterised protein [Rhodococcus rhodochrous]|uniref:Tox-REase-5 domain-containing protein n=1 Tax=Rhodococcus rhodochrous TaxID=1829 RepID=UPI000A549589|nr:Tox-REase-5 domain-containing protein [Rhodococcus rhodochrous]SNV24278.1 Uncharacterised protein [Rhodococcus rhodochrous]